MEGCAPSWVGASLGPVEDELAQSRRVAKRGGDSVTENEISRVVVGAAMTVHKALGPGLLESVYEAVLAFELRQRGLRVRRQVPVPSCMAVSALTRAFERTCWSGGGIVELKPVEKTAPVDKKQTLAYVRLADMRLGLLVSFGEALLKDGITRLVNRLPE